MTVEVEISGHRYRVDLERDGARWVATVNGRTLGVDAARTGTGWSLLIDDGHRDGVASRASYEIAFDDRGPGDAVVSVNGHALPAHVVDPRAWRRSGQRATGDGGSRTVTSAMPGRVVKVLVQPGERVAARQGLIVIEAMKMENELRAPADAVVRDVRVREGASVDAGAILIVLE